MESGSVDLIMACECIHWTRPEIAIAEFARELCAGGTLVITHYNYPRIVGHGKLFVRFMRARFMTRCLIMR